ncbi:hypothetical protein HELRODRAFT_191819 [Helobdella robusta]|uniref:Integrin alpha second immunoglobulin-like domain-containing protein n=1 Tax=Helobdella robusta TaxID=6412 RepID=T1FTC3_HELRO|nr:hypothetical protein HELRODRAFT_191819 [Helobdella robusta]ESO03978.1 hypothetical protein HELRODRAFT_191819 [Helobdella robusta]
MAITTARINNSLHYVIGQPVYHDILGKLWFTTRQNTSECQTNFELEEELRTKHPRSRYSYYGSSLLGMDVNGDGRDELLVGAPLFSEKNYDEGIVYVYSFHANGTLSREVVELHGSRRAWSRFGSSMVDIGDLNWDKYRDVAISAPYEETGVVYLFLGSQDSFEVQFSQRIVASSINANLNGFGYSLAQTFDDLGYSGLLVGAHKSNMVVRLKSKLVHQVNVSVTFQEDRIMWNHLQCTKSFNQETILPINLNFEYFTYGHERQIAAYTLLIDSKFRRGYHSNEKVQTVEGLINFRETCGQEKRVSHQWNITFPINAQPQNIKKGVTFDVTWFLTQLSTSNSVLSSNNTSYSNAIMFAQDCTEKCQPRLIPRSLNGMDGKLEYVHGSKDVLQAAFLVENVGEAAYNAQFDFSYPTFLFLNKIIVERSDCNDVMCEKVNSDPSNQQLKCYFNRPVLSNSSVRFNFSFNVQSHPNAADTNNALHLFINDKKSSIYLEPLYSSEIKIFNGSRANALLADVEEDMTFAVTNVFDVRNVGPGVHPGFNLNIRIPIFEQSAEKNPQCCFTSSMKISMKNGTSVQIRDAMENVTIEKPPPPSNSVDVDDPQKNPNSIFNMNCRTSSCTVHSAEVASLQANESFSINITVSFSHSLLKHLQSYTMFQYTSHLDINCIKLLVGVRNLSLEDTGCLKGGKYQAIYISNPVAARQSIPIWLIVVCIILGLLHWVMFVFVLKKCGFFRRASHERLIQEKRDAEENVNGEENLSCPKNKKKFDANLQTKCEPEQ